MHPEKPLLKTICLQLLLTTLLICIHQAAFSQNEPFDERIVNGSYQLNSAWELTYGPDDSLWVTENAAYKVSKINIANGGKTEILNISSVKSGFTTFPQGGLMGMALHPTMFTEWPSPSKPWVYLAYVYRFDGCIRNKKNNADSACLFKTKIVRYQYNRATSKLENEQVIIQQLNGSSDHNSGRLAIGKINGTDYLFYSIGDMGSGQFKNAKRPHRSQTRDSLEGKILRFLLEPSGNPSNVQSWIPSDNPYTNSSGQRTAVWSWGHRNAQGLAFGQNGILYSSEQQDVSDDEINIITKGGNYGWPLASGYYDGNYNGLSLAGNPVISEQADSITYQLKGPLYTLYTVPNPAMYMSQNNANWPTVACSSIDVYDKPVIPGWNQSLLVPSLKAGLIQRLKLDATGTKVIDTNTIAAMNRFDQIRYRDICISPDGLRIYASVDMSSKSNTYKGRIIEYTYKGSVLAIPSEPDKQPVRAAKTEAYPNPVRNTLHVRLAPDVQKPVHYKITSVTGRQLLSGKEFKETFSVSVESLPRGIYFLQIFNAIDKQVLSQTIVVQ